MNTLQDDILPLLTDTVYSILSDDETQREWTVQGFGMMRTYLDPEKTWRLNVYHPDLMIPGVSVHHNHPWNFTSWILGGVLTNVRYTSKTEPAMFQHSGTEGEAQFDFARIMTGIKSNVGDAGASSGVEAQGSCWLTPYSYDEYRAWQWYEMDHADIHETRYTPGCVTINRRVRVGSGEHADVFWPHGTPWVSAKPRLATQDEIRMVCSAGLEAMVSR